jgi:hypothetical protein
MPAPTYSWTTISNARIDANSPGDTDLVTDMRDNLEFLRELFLGSNTTIASVPHVHAGVTDGSVDAMTSDNILVNSAPDDDGDGDWSTSNVSIESDRGFLVSTTELASAYQIFTTRADLSKAMLGSSGADMVISLFVKAKTSAPTAGVLSFGLADGSATAYQAGCRGDIAFGSITTSWKRFYMTLTAKGGGASTDNRFLLLNGWSTNAALDQQVIVTCMAVNFGRSLTYWMPGVTEASGNDDTHDDWRRYGLTDVPCWERATAITNATAVTGA